MKTILYFLLILPFLSFAQEDKTVVFPKKKIAFEASGKMGFGKLNNDNIKNFSGDIVSKEVLLGYGLSNKLRLKAGFGLVEFSNSSFLGADFTNIDLSILQIPLKLNFTICSLNGSQLILGYGISANYSLKNKIETSTTVSESKPNDWNFYSVMDFGWETKIGKGIVFGVYLEEQYAPANLAKSEASRINSSQIKMSFIYLL